MCLLRVADCQIGAVVKENAVKHIKSGLTHSKKGSVVAGSLSVTNGAILPLTVLINFKLVTNVE